MDDRERALTLLRLRVAERFGWSWRELALIPNWLLPILAGRE